MKLDLLDAKELKSYPSGSGIEFFDGKIYLVGDDAGSIIVTNPGWEILYEIPLFKTAEKRIPKKQKADLEASAILQLDNTAFLLLVGSGSKKHRNKGILFDIKAGQKIEFDCSVFYERLQAAGIADINIEGATQVNEYLLFCNRGNKTNPSNQLIVTSTDFFRRQHEAPIAVQTMVMLTYEGAIGISGITYSSKHDYLLFTTSMEDTSNSYDDGPIGKSYLGIIHNANQKITSGKIEVNELIDLAGVNKKFAGYKIESACIESEDENNIILHLVADNDTGESFLFKVLLEV